MYFQSEGENSVDPDQLASSEASWSGSTLFLIEDISRFSATKVKYLQKSTLFSQISLASDSEFKDWGQSTPR